MSLRFTNLEQLANCSPAVRAQLEAAMKPAPDPATSAATQIAEHQARQHVAKKMARPEQVAGALLVKWMDLQTLPNGLKPGQFFYHVANGGGRDKTEAAILKGQGVRAGQPDYNLDLPAGPYHGLRLEIKAEDGAKPPDHQLEILQRLESVGYCCVVAWGFEDACRHIERYLDLIVRATAAAGQGRRPQAHGLPTDG